MKTLATSILVLLATAPVALADNNEALLLKSGNLVDVSELALNGNLNRLVIVQDHPGSGASNRVSVAIDGNRNGGPAGARFAPVAVKTGLAPGHVVQNGFGNSVKVAVRGEENLFAFSQVGNNNTVTGHVTGYQNQAAVAQVGNNNFASFTQNGIGNMISVRQYSW